MLDAALQLSGIDKRAVPIPHLQRRHQPRQREAHVVRRLVVDERLDLRRFPIPPSVHLARPLKPARRLVLRKQRQDFLRSRHRVARQPLYGHLLHRTEQAEQ